MNLRAHLKSMLLYVATALGSGIIVYNLLQLWRLDLSVPLSYSRAYDFFGDTLLTCMSIKTLIEHGWFLQNPTLGFPGGMSYVDFPTGDSLHFLLIKLLALFQPDFGATFNLFYLLTFILTPLTALFTLRHFKVSPGPAVVAALLFTYLPYHFLRGRAHLFLAAYFLVPLITLLALKVWDGSARFWGKGRTERLTALGLAILCLMIGAGGVYYAFFGCALLSVAMGVRALETGKIRAAVPGAIAVALIAGGLLLSVSPSIIYRAQHGRNQAVAVRNPADSEHLGMKITQLLLPVGDHRLSLLEKVKRKYDGFPLPNEGSETLGLLGSLGFMSLLLARLKPSRSELRNRLSVLNLSAVLLATIGGFGALVALALTPEIRAYNRISVFIAFFCFFELALLLEWIKGKWFEGRTRRWAVFYPALALLLTGGILDLYSPGFLPWYEGAKEEFVQDRTFVKAIEAQVPPGTKIFQLPAAPFPEPPPIHKLADYDLFRGYLHSSTLMWSYGAMRGRSAWHEQTAALPPGQLLPELAKAGFEGLYLDRNGYADGGQEAMDTLRSLTASRPLLSPNQRLAFFDLRGYVRRFHAEGTERHAGSLSRLAAPVALGRTP